MRLTAELTDAQIKNKKAVSDVAQAITVRVAGHKEGSGVLVKRDGNTYTVLSAWELVSSQSPSGKARIYTPDGREHKVGPSNIERIGKLDIGRITFASTQDYRPIDDESCKVNERESIFVSGYLTPSNQPTIAESSLIAEDIVNTSKGKAILYDEIILDKGLQGGAVLTESGCFLGLHLGKSPYQRTERLARMSKGVRITRDITESTYYSPASNDPYYTAACPLLGPFAVYVNTSFHLEPPVIKRSHNLAYAATLVTKEGIRQGAAEIYHGGDIFFSTVPSDSERTRGSYSEIEASFDRNLDISLGFPIFPHEVKTSHGAVTELCVSLHGKDHT